MLPDVASRVLARAKRVVDIVALHNKHDLRKLNGSINPLVSESISI